MEKIDYSALLSKIKINIRENEKNQQTFIIFTLLMFLLDAGILLLASPATALADLLTYLGTLFLTGVVFLANAVSFHHLVTKDTHEYERLKKQKEQEELKARHAKSRSQQHHVELNPKASYEPFLKGKLTTKTVKKAPPAAPNHHNTTFRNR